jgi:hypothetical protein
LIIISEVEKVAPAARTHRMPRRLGSVSNRFNMFDMRGKIRWEGKVYLTHLADENEIQVYGPNLE